ncbi:hypothetical protein [Halobacillus naozhouensis]|uniref:Integral membrane protein n=1 Tax=Halobacillus naozhouensis TaxID=554880 RepID=A0ABY8J3Y8_9BACI|nr:hypothetical protein [Halobacillus naozhouensis]WFT76133.1 hypothetical protein P9989_07160 [Halobacillus naozhouensis]
MKSRNNIGKIATDMSAIQLSWSAIFLLIAFLISIVARTVFAAPDVTQESFFTFVYQPSKIFMLVIGIISVSGFLTFYVKQGITRRDYFFGAAIAAFIVALLLNTMAGVTGAVEQFFFPSLETSSFLGPEASWLIMIIVYSLNILVYYIAGWLIGSGFYRFEGGGVFYIILAVALVSISDILWEFDLKNPLKIFLDFNYHWEFPLTVSFLGTFFLIGITLWIIQATTRRITIKMK